MNGKVLVFGPAPWKKPIAVTAGTPAVGRPCLISHDVEGHHEGYIVSSRVHIECPQCRELIAPDQDRCSCGIDAAVAEKYGIEWVQCMRASEWFWQQAHSGLRGKYIWAKAHTVFIYVNVYDGPEPS